MLKGTELVKRTVYRIPNRIKLDESDIWDRPEYRAYNYADMILSVVEVEQSVPYQKIKEILTNHFIPCDTGQIWYGLNQLKSKVKISPTFIVSIQKS